MNITIIIPALQPPQQHRNSESPQPTSTPFPAFTLSPSPNQVFSVTNSKSSSTTTNYCSECHSITNNEVTTTASFTKEREIPIVREGRHFQDEEIVRLQHPGDGRSGGEGEEAIPREVSTRDEVANQEIIQDSITELRQRRQSELHHQESFDSRFTESPSSPETVIHVGPFQPQSADDDYEEDFESYEELDLGYNTISQNQIQGNTSYLPGEPLPSEAEALVDNESEQKSTLPLAPSTNQYSKTGENTFHSTKMTNTSKKNSSKGMRMTDQEEILQGTTVPRRTKSGRKPKRLTYPDPRRPSNYPQRLNKVTLARQALAREKRRVYIEERIQKYLHHAQHHQCQTQTLKKDPTHQKLVLESLLPEVMEERITQTTSSILGFPPPETLTDLQLKKLSNMTQSLPDLDSQNYYLNHPSPSLLEELSQTSIPVARVLTRRSPFKNLIPSSASSVPLPHILFDKRQSNYPTSSIAENEQESSEQWGGAEHGYFYSFRVRESGAVQMLDKAVQTPNSDFSHGYTLEFQKQSPAAISVTNVKPGISIHKNNGGVHANSKVIPHQPVGLPLSQE